MKNVLTILSLLLFASCQQEVDSKIEESALNFFCTELLDQEIFLVWNEKEEMMFPPFELPEEFYEGGFLLGRKIFLQSQIKTLSTPIIFFDQSQTQDSLYLFSQFEKNFESNKGFSSFKIDVNCQNRITIESEDERLDDPNDYVLLEVRRHLSAFENKMVEITCTIAKKEFSFYILFDKSGKVIRWE
jgi:hypothetical protein